MDSPFFSNRRWYNQPDQSRRSFPHPSSYRGVPVYAVDPTQSNDRPKSGSKVIQIPVQFVGSKQASPSDHALRIQKILRGFLVRKNVKKIKDIRVRVEEIEGRLSKSDVVELIRKDDRERLRMNETLMSLLFKLDSIRGINSGVRDLRKGVTRKAIVLQERIDAVVATDLEEKCEIGGEVDEGYQTLGIMKCVENGDLGELDCVSGEGNDEIGSGEKEDGVKNPGYLDNSTEFQENLGDSSMEVEESNGEIGVTDVGVDCEVKVRDEFESKDEIGRGKRENSEILDAAIEFQENMDDSHMEVEEDNGETGITDVGVDCEVKATEADSAEKNLHSLEHGTVNDEMDKFDDRIRVENDGKQIEGKGDDNRSENELLDRIMKDNEKMMRMMRELVDRNEMQTQVMNALTQRVELLEKAFVCDVLTRKKKKIDDACRGE